MDIPYMIDDRIIACSQQPPEIAGTWFRQGRPAGNVIMVKNGKSSARKKRMSYTYFVCPLRLRTSLIESQ